MSGEDVDARARDLCRDSRRRFRNPLNLKRTVGSQSAQNTPKSAFSTLIEPTENARSRGQAELRHWSDSDPDKRSDVSPPLLCPFSDLSFTRNDSREVPIILGRHLGNHAQVVACIKLF